MKEDELKTIVLALIHILKLFKPQPLGLSVQWFENGRKSTDEIISLLEEKFNINENEEKNERN